MVCGKGCKQVTFGPDVNEFEVKGNTLVYAAGLGLERHVHLVDLAQDREWRVRPSIPDRPGCKHIATDERRLAYTCMIFPTDTDRWTQTLTEYDITTHTETDLRSFFVGCASPGNASSCGCVPQAIALGATGIAINMSLTICQHIDTHFYRFADDSFTNLTNKHGGCWEVAMSGTRLVWTEVVGLYTQIVIYDTVTRTRRVLAPNPAGQFHPRIEGDRVVWVDHRNAPGDMWNQGNSDIYVHDLATGKTVAVTTHPAMQDYPDVYGDWVVWEDWRNNPKPIPRYGGDFKNADIFARNVKTGEEVQLTQFPGMELRPQVDNGRVFFSMTISIGKGALFMIDLAKFLKQ